VIAVSSRGWLKWVCSTTSLWSLRPRSTIAVSASTHSSSVMSFIGITAGPLVAKRMRRTLSQSRSALPISVICRALS
jgi:hypothetical protein